MVLVHGVVAGGVLRVWVQVVVVVHVDGVVGGGGGRVQGLYLQTVVLLHGGVDGVRKCS